MTRFSKFLIVWWGVVLVLAGCGTAKEVIVGETAVSASSVQAPSASSGQAVTPTVVQPIPPTNTPTNIPTDSPQPIRANYPNLGSAPELENEVWLNTEQPVTLASQQGKVVLVEFWTYG